jgi:hypothetical protein
MNVLEQALEALKSSEKYLPAGHEHAAVMVVIAALKEAIKQHGEPALSRFTDSGGYEEQDPVERLRFFCSLAMKGQDWLDVEPFFDAIKQQGEPVAWVQSLSQPQPHCVTDLKYCAVAQWDCGDHLEYIPLYTHPQPSKPMTNNKE